MELSSFEFGLRLFLPIYSRAIMIDRYGTFTAFEKDIYKLGVMSKFYYWNENDFRISMWCAIYTKPFTEFINNLERLLGRLVMNAMFNIVLM